MLDDMMKDDGNTLFITIFMAMAIAIGGLVGVYKYAMNDDGASLVVVTQMAETQGK